MLDCMLLPREHDQRNGKARQNRERRIGPPQMRSDGNSSIAEQGWPEDQEAVDDGRKPHGNAAKEHRDDGMIEGPERSTGMQ
jgi:hypothetical protein